MVSYVRCNGAMVYWCHVMVSWGHDVMVSTCVSSTDLTPNFSLLSPIFSGIFKALTLWADTFYKPKCPSVCLCVCLSVCPSHFLTPFKGLFAPTFWNSMSKLLRYLESLRKINGKKWSQIWKLLLIRGEKLPRQNFFLQIFFICSLRLSVFLSPFPKVQYPNILDIWNPCRSVMEWSDLRFKNFCS